MPHKILIADDDPDVLFVLENLLLKSGYSVITAKDGMETLEKVKTDKPDLLILDIMMPKLDGHSVNIKLKEDPKTAHIPVIVITAYAHFKKLLDIREELSVAGFLEKPFPVQKLTELIAETLKT